MADWLEWLEGISGGAMGVTKGLTAGAEPFKAWEGVRGADLANDLSDVRLRDAQLLQQALEGTDYYNTSAGAKTATNRKTTSQAESDIFGLERNLAKQKYLSDPNDAFQQGIAATGWTPEDVEFRKWLAEAESMFDPMSSVKSYDAFGIPGMEQRNVNEQAMLQFAEKYIQQNGPDPNAQLVRAADGTVSIFSNGELTEVPGDVLVKIAAGLQPAGPEAAIRQGVGQEIAIQNSNANLYKALTSGQLTNKDRLELVNKQRLLLQNELGNASSAMKAILAGAEYKDADLRGDEETKRRLVAEPAQRVMKVRQALDQLQGLYTRLAAGGGMPAGAPGVRPQGGTTVTTRPPPGIARRAAGAVGAPVGAPPGVPPAGRPSGPIGTGNAEFGGNYDQTLIDLMNQAMGGG